MDEQKLQDAIANPQNLGEMPDADAVGTVGSPDCGDMLRMWIKYADKEGRKVIDKASFQSFGCQTAIAVASLATQMIQGKTREEALRLKADELSAESPDEVLLDAPALEASLLSSELLACEPLEDTAPDWLL